MRAPCARAPRAPGTAGPTCARRLPPPPKVHGHRARSARSGPCGLADLRVCTPLARRKRFSLPSRSDDGPHVIACAHDCVRAPVRSALWAGQAGAAPRAVRAAGPRRGLKACSGAHAARARTQAAHGRCGLLRLCGGQPCRAERPGLQLFARAPRAPCSSSLRTCTAHAPRRARGQAHPQRPGAPGRLWDRSERAPAAGA
mmetsp:Transcript_63552/g.200790  ORF Transcript_63552/g.200790 Transcript_63552/m.200790 type:complete len:200 (-) Transcript_63552:32-631(-)